MTDTPIKVIVRSFALAGEFEAEIRDLDDLREILIKTYGRACLVCPEIHRVEVGE